MKKSSSKIREEIVKLQDQLKQAETREAERIGRLALKAGLGGIELEDAVLQAAFEELVTRFHAPPHHARPKQHGAFDRARTDDASVTPGSAPGGSSEA